jgi:DNA polymerase III alpha subunit
VTYDLPAMEEYLKDTFGICVYQEQIMLLSQKLAGFSKGDADVLRKAMGKKQKAVLDKMKGQFVEGAVAKGHPADKLEKIWTDWKPSRRMPSTKATPPATPSWPTRPPTSRPTTPASTWRRY